MRFHVVGLPHTTLGMEHSACAFSMKARHVIQMLESLGHKCFHYGVEGSDIGNWCVEDVTVLSRKEQEGFFGPYDANALYDVQWTSDAPYWKLLNERAAAEINKRKQPRDFVLIITGNLSLPLVEAVEGDVMVVEYGAGYNGLLPRKQGRYRVYESFSHMHKLWGADDGYDPDGYWFDRVIPNYLNPEDYPLQVKKDDYYLYLGRLVKRKGIHIAVETCKRIGAKLKIAGQGCTKVERIEGGQRIHCADGEVYEGDLEYVGFATGDKRAKLYGGALATFIATTYTEPFGAVAVECQFAGTPAITTDFGAFPETVIHGKTGFRCHTLNEFMWAAKEAPKLNPYVIHQHAVANYSMDVVRWRYESYFNQLQDLWGEGWYAQHDAPDAHWLQGYSQP